MKAFWLLVAINLPLTVMSAQCPDKCLCLWYFDRSLTINCSGSDQTEVPPGIDPQVKILVLSYNELRSYNHSKYLKTIEMIDLSNNKVSQASFGGSFKYLQSIDLSYNSFADLGKIDVEKLTHLKKLNVSHNSKLQSLSGLKSESLEQLDLSHCFVSYLDEKFLEDLPNIKSLDISFNSFQSLTNVHSDSLEVLDASHGSLENLTQQEIYNLPGLTKLNVSFNSNLKINFSYDNSCWGVKELDVSNSDLSSLDEMFPFCSLEALNASLNKIKIIEVRTFFNNCELSFVNLSNNQISDIQSRAFFTSDKLKILDLSANQIQDVDFSIYLKRVVDLNLSRNKICNITGLVLKKVVNLNLAHNKIKEVSINFNENMPEIQKLNLSFNKIKSITGIRSKTLTHIDLSNCKIVYVDLKAFEGAENLVHIDLGGNKLGIVDFRIFKELENLIELSLWGNQWTCNCQSPEFKGLYEFLAIERPLTNLQELRCIKSNHTWRNTCADAWQKEKEWKKTVYSLTVSLVIALIVVAVIFFCKYFNDKKQMEETQRRVRERENANSRLSSYENSTTTVHITEDQGIFSNRSSTPPPNYEAALLLPKLTEEQRNLAISTLSIASPPVAEQEEIAREPQDDETNNST